MGNTLHRVTTRPRRIQPGWMRLPSFSLLLAWAGLGWGGQFARCLLVVRPLFFLPRGCCPVWSSDWPGHTSAVTREGIRSLSHFISAPRLACDRDGAPSPSGGGKHIAPGHNATAANPAWLDAVALFPPFCWPGLDWAGEGAIRAVPLGGIPPTFFFHCDRLAFGLGTWGRMNG